MNQILEISKESAQQMTSHADADAKYDAFKKRWVVIDATAKDWIGKYEKMVDVWAKQAETAAKVTAAICEYFRIHCPNWVQYPLPRLGPVFTAQIGSSIHCPNWV